MSPLNSTQSPDPGLYSTPDPEIERILTFWFSPTDGIRRRWFSGGPEVDVLIKSQFSTLVAAARARELDGWTASPRGTLALLILLDQFPRNIFRGSGESFASDRRARDVTVEAIAKGQDREVLNLEAPFFYLPLMHDETLLGQIAALSLIEGLKARCGGEAEELQQFANMSLTLSEKHLRCIERFGRFPARNQALGRESSEDEIKYLEENPRGF